MHVGRFQEARSPCQGIAGLALFGLRLRKLELAREPNESELICFSRH